MFLTHVYRRMLQVFQLFRTYVANVSSICYKSRSGVAHVAVDPIHSICLLYLLGPLACVWVWRWHERQVRGHEAARTTVCAQDTERLKALVWFWIIDET
jgi:uncharacterized membrane protein YhaH (DUF805 family)